jgi:hypothetical protein
VLSSYSRARAREISRSGASRRQIGVDPLREAHVNVHGREAFEGLLNLVNKVKQHVAISGERTRVL